MKNINQVNDSRLTSIQLPEKFEIEIYADHVENARSMVPGAIGYEHKIGGKSNVGMTGIQFPGPFLAHCNP